MKVLYVLFVILLAYSIYLHIQILQIDHELQSVIDWKEEFDPLMRDILRAVIDDLITLFDVVFGP